MTPFRRTVGAARRSAVQSRETDTTQINAALAALYREHWSSCQAELRRHPSLSNPLLLNVPDRLDKQPIRLLTVGQQTGPRRWQPDLDVRRSGSRQGVAALMRRYANFAMGTVEGTAHFWRFLRLLEAHLGLEAGQSLWNNLNKCDDAGGRPRKAGQALWEAFPVLPAEVRLLQPTLVVFVTGPTYDDLLGSRLGASLERVKGWPVKSLARVRAEGLPEASFRTYHPNFLLRFRKSLADELLRVLHAAAFARGSQGPTSARPARRAARNPARLELASTRFARRGTLPPHRSCP